MQSWQHVVRGTHCSLEYTSEDISLEGQQHANEKQKRRTDLNGQRGALQVLEAPDTVHVGIAGDHELSERQRVIVELEQLREGPVVLHSDTVARTQSDGNYRKCKKVEENRGC